MPLSTISRWSPMSPSGFFRAVLLTFLALAAPTRAADVAPRMLLLAGAQPGPETIVAVGERATILRSTDAARTWQAATITASATFAPSATLTGLSFAPDGQHGWAVGHDALILATSDAGRTWQKSWQGENLTESFLDVLALDAKVSFDSNALYRHPEIVALRDLNEEDPKEIEASKYDLAYIALDGNIACLVNGAGLAMSTMDIIKHYGGNPANFLDVGGGASKDKVVAAFKIILGDTNVKGIFVNIFGGIMDCNVIAEGVVEAVKEVGLKLPLVVRLEGNNVAAGKATLAKSGLALVSGDTMADAAQKIVKLVA
eukprot:gene42207-51542_t